MASDGTVGNNQSIDSNISPDGRFVVFSSESNNLVSGDTNGKSDVFVHDRQTSQTERVSVASDSTQANNNSGSWLFISSGGRYIAFASTADNLVAGDTNVVQDIFVNDRQTGQTERVSVASDGTQANGGGSNLGLYGSMTPDGRFIAFTSDANNLVPGDTNGVVGTYIHDRQTGQTERVDVASDGTGGNNYGSDQPSVSSDGRYVAFFSESDNLIFGDTNEIADIFMHDRQTDETTRVSVASDGTQPTAESQMPSVSANGQFVVFNSQASNLVPGDNNICGSVPGANCPDVFIHNMLSGQTTRISVANDGSEGNNRSWYASITSDGQFAVFESDASNLVPNDNNNATDIFVKELFLPGADLSVSQSDSSDPVALGSNLTYTILAKNNGTALATGVILADVLPVNASLLNISSSQGNCSGTSTITCSLGNLAGNTTAIVSVEVRPTTTGVITNAVSVSGNETDPVPGNNSSTEGTTVVPTAQLSRLTVAVQGQGTVTSNPAGINCHPICIADYGPGSTVTLTATSLNGWQFDRWEAACQGQSNPCAVTLGSDLLVRAVFSRTH